MGLYQSVLVTLCNVFGSLVLVILLLPWVLATIAVWWHRHYGTTCTTRSAVYAGRVWHTRLRPVRHAFTYPIFLFGVDLEEIEETVDDSTKGSRRSRLLTRLWPLTWIASFHSTDHLKNGEGATDEPQSQSATRTLSDRVCRLVAERTQGSFCPTTTTHRILLLTHWTYFGYCFNPVSFYYIQEKCTKEAVGNGNPDEPIRAVVGEVSNTPWNEMHCYVLHPDSTDHVQCSTITQPVQGANLSNAPILPTIHYVFPKKFHVSPFMEMAYDYDWTFRHFDTGDDASWIHVTNSLRQPSPVASNGTKDATTQSPSTHTPTLQFHARLEVERHSLHPYRIAYQLSILPLHCVVIQVWIHYEAARLFLKGVVYQPHPTGAETTASRWIGTIMTPFFMLRDQWNGTRSTSHKPKTS